MFTRTGLLRSASSSSLYIEALLERTQCAHPDWRHRPTKADRERDGRHERRVNMVVPIGWLVGGDDVAARLGQSRSMVIRGAVSVGLKAYLAAGISVPVDCRAEPRSSRRATRYAGTFHAVWHVVNGLTANIEALPGFRDDLDLGRSGDAHLQEAARGALDRR